jgi:glycosyltransferase involved in cell wall biosynthesis
MVMGHNIKFSIIVPAYKTQFFKECIDSILNQTYEDFELIIVNDGSPQSVGSIVAQYHDSRIQYHYRKVGLGAKRLVENWNDCLKYVKGEFVINMGDDDKLLPDCLWDYNELIRRHPGLDVYHMRAWKIDQNSNIIGVQAAAPEWESAYSLLWHQWHGRETWIGDFLYRVSSLQKRGGYFDLPYAWHSDCMTPLIAARTGGIANTCQPGFCFRYSPFQITADTSLVDDRLSVWAPVRKWYADFLAEEPDGLLDRFYWKKLKYELNDKIKSYIMYDIGRDVFYCHHHIFHWFRVRKKYGLSIGNIAKLIRKRILRPVFSRKTRGKGYK